MTWTTQFDGFVGRAPEQKQVKGSDILEISVAVSVPGDDEDTWVSCSAWNRLAEALVKKNIGPGDEVSVTGKVRSFRVYKKNDGTLGKSVSLTATSVKILTTKAERDCLKQNGFRTQADGGGRGSGGSGGGQSWGGNNGGGNNGGGSGGGQSWGGGGGSGGDSSWGSTRSDSIPF